MIVAIYARKSTDQHLPRAEMPTQHSLRQRAVLALRAIAVRLLLVVCVLCLFSHDAFCMSGNDWNGLSKADRDMYVFGVVDGWALVAMGARQRTPKDDSPSVAPIETVLDCLNSRQMPNAQAWAIVDKYMKDNPHRWNYTMAGLIWTALNDACKK